MLHLESALSVFTSIPRRMEPRSLIWSAIVSVRNYCAESVSKTFSRLGNLIRTCQRSKLVAQGPMYEFPPFRLDTANQCLAQNLFPVPPKNRGSRFRLYSLRALADRRKYEYRNHRLH